VALRSGSAGTISGVPDADYSLNGPTWPNSEGREYVSHGFLRDMQGAITVFDPPGHPEVDCGQILPDGVAFTDKVKLVRKGN
jgi:hypothetical protein